ncbi:MAG TPA: hypothetical protein VKB86_11340 [Pyrinomonadaceae bacterium]|nr:hypothetical protein [Pyrinomonadaceae bacterium]
MRSFQLLSLMQDETIIAERAAIEAMMAAVMRAVGVISIEAGLDVFSHFGL